MLMLWQLLTTSETDIGTTLIFDRATTLWQCQQRRCASWVHGLSLEVKEKYCYLGATIGPTEGVSVGACFSNNNGMDDV